MKIMRQWRTYIGHMPMAREEWIVERTDRYVEDLAHFSILDDRAAQWERSIAHHPLIGEVWEEGGGTSLRRYETGDLWVVYAFSWERSTVWMAQIRRKSDDPKPPSKGWGLLKTAWERFVQITVVGR